MTCHSVNPNNPYEIYKLPHISPRFRTKCYYLPVVLNKQRILYKNQLLTISRKKERERSSFLALGLLSIMADTKTLKLLDNPDFFVTSFAALNA